MTFAIHSNADNDSEPGLGGVITRSRLPAKRASSYMSACTNINTVYFSGGQAPSCCRSYNKMYSATRPFNTCSMYI